ncbi:hypothetical protein [uncultured Williamsia sp.]|uniref:hypothetical protein n=1 Tax=uncultured Williamsia sp. TaxID=259311 RepID=UPI00260C60C7|nr:hypothetical protein [uncultured Williamsia sp.]
MTVVRRIATVWSGGVGILVAVALVALLAVVVGTPAWWVSLLVTSTVAAAVAIWVIRVVRPSDGVVAAAVCLVVVAAAGGLLGAAIHARSDARSVAAAQSDVGRVGGPTICRVIDRGTPARAAAAAAAATGDLADRLRSGTTVLGAVGGDAVCRPIQTAVADATADSVGVVALIEVTVDGATSTRAVTADLRRVAGRWAVATLQVVR